MSEKYTIYYIDDDEYALNSFVVSYRRKGYEVFPFQTASEFEKKLSEAKDKPHVIISDQKLGQDTLGWQLLKNSISLSPNSVRLIMSGYWESDMIINSFKQGLVDDYIIKSESQQQIDIKIVKACETWREKNSKNMAIDSRNDLLAQVIAARKETVALNELLRTKDVEIAKTKQLIQELQQMVTQLKSKKAA